MNIALIGSGGREHVLCQKIYESKLSKNIIFIPGNAGTAKIAKNIDLDSSVITIGSYDGVHRGHLEIIRSDQENNLLYIKGSIPGSKNSEVFLRDSIKSINKKTVKEKFETKSKITETSKNKKTVSAKPKKADPAKKP